jgi:hypothetical protein
MRNTRLTWHAAFWAFHFANELLIAIAEQRSLWLESLASLRLFSFLAVVAYVNLFVLVPRLWRRGHRGGHVAALAASAAIASLAFTMTFGQGTIDANAIRGAIRWTFTSLLYAASIAALDFGVRQLDAERKLALQRLDNLMARLDPHFLFNTLNALYSLAVQSRPDLPQLIERHATLLRHAVDLSRQPLVKLADEIEFVSSYMELQALRLDESVPVAFEVDGVAGDQRIPPMLFTPLVENCFKHFTPSADGEGRISGRMLVDGQYVEIILRNSAATTSRQAKHSGLGLAATRERLEILFPGRHVLDVRFDGGEHVARLRLELAH